VNKRASHIDAFTIFEVTVVIAIMSVIIGLIAISMNRFNEQLKVSSDLSVELNEWFAFRANLWNELYETDSVTYKNNELQLVQNERAVGYKLDGDQLLRSQTGQWIDTKMEASEIGIHEEDRRINVFFDFHWKGEIMTLSYLVEPDSKAKINSYFETLE
jgi:competence protein ComGF